METPTETVPTAPLPDGYTITAKPYKGSAIYTIQDTDNRKTAEYTHSDPVTITPLSIVGREIKRHLDPENDLSSRGIDRKFEEVKILLQAQFDTVIIEEETRTLRAQQEDEETYQENMTRARELIQSKELPLIYIASLISWLTAGERCNILLSFISYASQVILRNPISVIGLGEGSSGKTHIEEEGLKLIPPHYIRLEKSVTEAAMMNRAKEDPYYYDGCIVSYGDLGGRNSQEFILEAKNLLKELQTDGILNKPLNIPTRDGWMVQDITLLGFPCLTYTTVPGFKFDDQELSRSIFITPRMDNKAVFNARKKVMELKHGRTYNLFLKYSKKAELVKYIVQLLRDEIEGLTIINPYTQMIIDFLGESEYFKRDFDKYNGILKTITAFHCFTRPTFNLNGETILFTSLNDVKLFISLLESYHDSISVNISPKSSEILEELRNMWSEWTLDRKISDLGITTSQYFELSQLKLGKRSIQRYFGELNQNGFLKIVGQDNRMGVYALSGRALRTTPDHFLTLGVEDKEMIKYEIGDAALEFIEEDALMEGLSIYLNDPGVDVPGWETYDKRQ